MFDAICANCGKKIQVKFKPDGVRPVYCKDCLPKMREQKNSSSFHPTRNFAPRDNIQNQRPSDEILIHDTGQPVSLAEAARKGPAKFSDSRRKKKEVNLSELRETLHEVLKNEGENDAEEEKSSSFLGQNSKRSENKPDNSNGEILDEGEKVEL
jgi:CxxC-x17-CxxC domain-containing protein